MRNAQKPEWKIMAEIAKAVSRGGNRLFENRVGTVRDQFTNQYISFGVGGKGAADLIGWKAVEITPDMVGRTVAVFTAIEVKRPGKQARADQEAFLQRVRDAGGIAGVARSVQQARALKLK